MPDINVNKLSEALNTKADIDLNNTGVFSTSEGGVVNLVQSTPSDAKGKEVSSADFSIKQGGLELMDVVFAPLGIDESKNKRRYLNGQVLIQEQFPAFTAAVKARMATMSNAFTTETNWQAEKTNSKLGQCGKFVVDDTAGTIRLPCVVNAQGLADLSLIGGIKSESLPNITSGTNWFMTVGGTTSNPTTTSFPASGATTAPVGSVVQGHNGNNFEFPWTRLDASLQSISYQDNAPVQQEAVQYPYCIVVNTGVEESDRPINNYQINNVYSYGMSQYYKGTMNNNSWLKSAGQWNSGTVYTGMYNWLIEQMNNGVSGFVASTAAYTDYDFVINQTDQTFRLPLLNGDRVLVKKYVNGTDWYNLYSDGYLEQGGSAKGIPNFTISFLKPFRDANYTIITTTRTASDDATVRTMEPILGQILASSCSLRSCPSFNGTQFFWQACGYAHVPTQSDFTEVSGLYYYIGDTLQNAQLINVARIEETLVNKTNKVQAAEASMPSNRYIDLTLGASGQTYTAPANGWFAIAKVAGADFYYTDIVVLKDPNGGTDQNNSKFGTFSEAYRSSPCESMAQVKKGDVVIVNYNATGVTNYFRFIYAEGEN